MVGNTDDTWRTCCTVAALDYTITKHGINKLLYRSLLLQGGPWKAHELLKPVIVVQTTILFYC